MSLQAVLLPVFVQVLLTFVLLGLMGRARFEAGRRGEVRIKDIALGQNAWPEKPAKLSRAYSNQFELPLLFFALVPLALIARKADLLFVIMSWMFVALRVAHAWVHAGSNVVMTRFRLFVAGMVVLMAMWIVFAARVLFA